jgi:hypothetical protein
MGILRLNLIFFSRENDFPWKEIPEFRNFSKFKGKLWNWEREIEQQIW